MLKRVASRSFFGRYCFVCLAVFLLAVLGMSRCYAASGWVYSNYGAAYYPTSLESENVAFTWTGHWANGKVHAYGTQTFYSADGKILGTYEGDMEYGYRQGHGTLSWGGLRYAGQWQESKFSGYGTLTRASDRYIGQFVDGRRHGYGMWVNAEGLITAGRFFDDRYVDNGFLYPGYFVIGLCSRDQKAAQDEATKHRTNGLRPIVAYSSDWLDLAPGWYIVVYGILHTEEEVRALEGFRLGDGIAYYIKRSGSHRE